MNTSFNASEFIKGKYLKGADLDRRKPVRVTVDGVDQREFPEQGKKLILSFLEIDQELVLNKTQVSTMIDLFGVDTGLWRGQRLHLIQVTSSYQGKPTILITEAEPVAPSVRGAQESGDVLFEKETEF
jgi:hypothetical protein